MPPPNERTCIMHPFGHTTKLLEQFSGLTSEQVQVILGSGYLPAIKLAIQKGRLPPKESLWDFLGVVVATTVAVLDDVRIFSTQEYNLAGRVRDGKYDRVDENIIEGNHFSLSLPSGPRDLVLAHFNQRLNSISVEEWARTNGYKSAPIDDLLAVGSHHRHSILQFSYPIIALGSHAEIGSRWLAPYLGKNNAGRVLGLWDSETDFSEKCRFLFYKDPGVSNKAISYRT
jgi:hypothetical protein